MDLATYVVSSEIFDAALPLPEAVQTMGNKVVQGTRHMGTTLYGETYH